MHRPRGPPSLGRRNRLREANGLEYVGKRRERVFVRIVSFWMRASSSAVSSFPMINRGALSVCCSRACVHPDHRPVGGVLGIGDGWARCRRNAVDGKSPSHRREACTLPHPPGPVHHRGRALRLWSPQLLLLRPLHRHLELLWQVWSALVSLGRCSSALREPSLWRGNRRATLRNPEAPNCTANQAPDK